jgi:uncharacterized protein (TIGR00297 family)
VKIKTKQEEGTAEKRGGRRGPSSVWGSGIAGTVCAVATIAGVGGPECQFLWQLGFLASFCTKLSDTISSEIGKAFGNTTYLVTTLSIVPRGTEGAVSVTGTLAGLFASIFLALVGLAIHMVHLLFLAPFYFFHNNMFCLHPSSLALVGHAFNMVHPLLHLLF